MHIIIIIIIKHHTLDSLINYQAPETFQLQLLFREGVEPNYGVRCMLSLRVLKGNGQGLTSSPYTLAFKVCVFCQRFRIRLVL